MSLLKSKSSSNANAVGQHLLSCEFKFECVCVCVFWFRFVNAWWAPALSSHLGNSWILGVWHMHHSCIQCPWSCKPEVALSIWILSRWVRPQCKDSFVLGFGSVLLIDGLLYVGLSTCTNHFYGIQFLLAPLIHRYFHKAMPKRELKQTAVNYRTFISQSTHGWGSWISTLHTRFNHMNLWASHCARLQTASWSWPRHWSPHIQWTILIPASSWHALRCPKKDRMRIKQFN